MTDIAIADALEGDIITITNGERTVTAPKARMPFGDYGHGTIALDLYGDMTEGAKVFTFFISRGFWEVVSVVRPVRKVEATITLPTLDEITEEIMSHGFCYRADAAIAAGSILALLKRNEVKP